VGLGTAAGSLVRIGPNILITSNPDVLFKISGARSGYRRSSQYFATRLKPGMNHVLAEMDETRHLELKTKLAVGVSLHIIS
jgi:hypothetical protein